MHQNSKYSFESFIIQCCKAKEWDLRKFLKKKLIKEGFSIQEDSYLSRRCGMSDKYNTVHNLLAIRGKPRVCLVAHTDVCRDHSWMMSRLESEVNPVLKNWGYDEAPRMIIQDATCKTQVGGDDRLGVAINTWIALNTGYDMALLFTTDEEIGLISAGHCEFPELKTFDLLAQVDRGNMNTQLVTNISGTKLCSDKTTKRLLEIAEGMGVPRDRVSGMITDVYAIKSRGRCNDAINMTCGYHNGHSNDEYIDVEEAKICLRYVSEIIKYYDLQLDKDEDKDIENTEEENKEEIKTYTSSSEEFDIESYIREFGIELKPKKMKVSKSLGKRNRKKKYIEAIFDEDLYKEHKFN